MVSTTSAIATFATVKYTGIDIKKATKLTAIIFASVSARVNVLKVVGEYA
jgi:hypothetical protein